MKDLYKEYSAYLATCFEPNNDKDKIKIFNKLKHVLSKKYTGMINEPKYTIVKKNNKYQVRNKSNVILNNLLFDKVTYINKGFFKCENNVSKRIYSLDKSISGREANKSDFMSNIEYYVDTFGGISFYDQFKDKYYFLRMIPIKNYDDYILCVDRNEMVYLFNKKLKNYTFFVENNSLDNLNYVGNDNLRFDNKLYYVGKDIIDVSLYTNNNYKNINPNKNDVMDYIDFCYYYNNIKNKQKCNSLRELSILIHEFETGKKYETDYGHLQIPVEYLFMNIDDHKEINPIFYDILRYIDLSNISFDNVKVSGIDFSRTNAKIDPQKVYKKDMSNGKYVGIDFSKCSFSHVNKQNSIFKVVSKTK